MHAVFSGPDAFREFLDPAKNAPTPLIELPSSLNPFSGEKVRVYAKASFLAPFFNIKQLAALNLLREAEAAGRLRGVHTLVESSSGNMILGIGVLAKYFGIRRVVGVVPRDIAPGKLELLRLFGIDPEFSNDEPGAASGITKAAQMGAQPGWLNLGQYGNEANPAAYEKWLAPALWEQSEGMLTVFAAGLGTTGTLVGSARYLKQRGVTIVALTPAVDTVPGVRSPRRLREVEFPWKDTLDARLDVATKESFAASLALCRLGLFAGPSSGMALTGLLAFLKERKDAGTLDALRNAHGEVVAAFVCPDSALLYLEKYSTHLDPADLG